MSALAMEFIAVSIRSCGSRNQQSLKRRWLEECLDFVLFFRNLIGMSFGHVVPWRKWETAKGEALRLWLIRYVFVLLRR